ncbi:hypothetical protein BN8_p06721 (plasmid) [Fibrisoma limi BUZ 3]|uniref:Copper-binding protein MbnP-like domain-containing protein n=1 Tax=Fibrisoma limi BUZ 3 TaxID=1185876 RepID=I2GTT9_9BACT|nr:hypothetical protein BN8_p06721 [Fibrisoma limi BUZ 3]
MALPHQRTPTTKVGDRHRVSIHFSLQVDEQPLTLDSLRYTNRFGERYALSSLAFYVSNVRLLRGEQAAYAIPQDSSYFLIRAADRPSQTLSLPQVPPGTYTGVEFIVGVDSLRSVSDISHRTGVLDPTEVTEEDGAMYWEWNSGYIFLKMEGYSPQAPLDPSGRRSFQYHIGGFGGYDEPGLNNLKRVRVLFPRALTVGKGAVPQVNLAVNLNQVFDGPNPIRLSRTPSIMFSPASKQVADNYATMFSLQSIQNQ